MWDGAGVGRCLSAACLQALRWMLFFEKVVRVNRAVILNEYECSIKVDVMCEMLQGIEESNDAFGEFHYGAYNTCLLIVQNILSLLFSYVKIVFTNNYSLLHCKTIVVFLTRSFCAEPLCVMTTAMVPLFLMYLLGKRLENNSILG